MHCLARNLGNGEWNIKYNCDFFFTINSLVIAYDREEQRKWAEYIYKKALEGK